MDINKIKIGQIIFGFRLKRKKEIKEINSFFYELEHIKTGAKYIHLERDDRENVFCVAFKTIPSDSTGVAHILEHTILAGSKKFPVNDPFFSMIKRSLKTFMNAFTAPDWTAYPFATANLKDFYNLMDVYLDAVFFPSLKETSFRQEGWRFDFDKNNLVYKGVVYNEMKGSMSNPARVLEEKISETLYPDTTYKYNSGGDPKEIPKLRYKRFKEFHKKYYHPSNALFYSYGNFQLKKHLKFVETKILRKFEKSKISFDIPKQPRWSEPQEATDYYSLSKEEDPKKKSQICVNWLTADVCDSFNSLVMIILERILVGNSSAPLYKALMDSGLGTSLSDGYGLDEDFLRDMVFSIGLKDTLKTNDKKIEKIIINKLKNLVNKGIDKKLIDLAIHKLEFEHKEITNHPYPYGLSAWLSIISPWLHGGDPFSRLCFNDDLEKIKREIKKGKFFEKKIKEFFLTNNHKALVKLIPDQKLSELKELKEKNKLQKIQERLSKSEIEKIKKDAKKLKNEQEKKENIDCLPILEIKDISSFVKSAKEDKNLSQDKIKFYNKPTGEIFYQSFLFGISDIKEELLSLIPFFCYALFKVGTKDKDYVEFENLIDMHTGGVRASVNVHDGFGEIGCIPFISVSAKCLGRNQEKMFKIISDLFKGVDFSDTKRLKKLLLEYNAGLESTLLDNGHIFSIAHSASTLTRTNALKEKLKGIEQIKFIKDFSKNLRKNKLKKLVNDLNYLANSVFSKENVKMSSVGEIKDLKKSKKYIKTIENSLAKKSRNTFGCPEFNFKRDSLAKAFNVSSEISFVGMSFKVPKLDHPDAPAISVISRLLHREYMHKEIREKGGAYGGFARYNSETGVFSFASYRDPHIVRTIEKSKKSFDFIKSGKYTEENIKESILQIFSEIDKPEPPAIEAYGAFVRELIGLEDKIKKKFRDKLLKLKKADIQEVAKKYFVDKNMNIVVISFEKKIKVANKKLEKRLDVVKI